MCYEETGFKYVHMGFFSFSLARFARVSQTEQGVEVKDAPRIDPESMSDLVESLEFLSKAGSFSFTAEVEYDASRGTGRG